MRIAIFFNKYREDTAGIYFERALTSLGISHDHFWARDAVQVDRVYDLYLRIEDSYFKDELPQDMKPKAYWASDTHLPKSFQEIVRITRGYDYVFCTGRRGMADLQKQSIPAQWVSYACDPEIHKRLDMPKIYDVGYVGTDGGCPRKFYLQELRERYPSSFIGQASYLEMSRIYSQSKIGFSFAIRHEHFTMRSFEIPACGAMLLMHRLKDDSAEQLGYIPGKHFVQFEGPDDLFGKIDYYLSHEEERARIAEEGHQFTIQNHTYTHRMQGMLKHMGLAPSSFRREKA